MNFMSDDFEQQSIQVKRKLGEQPLKEQQQQLITALSMYRKHIFADHITEAQVAVQ